MAVAGVGWGIYSLRGRNQRQPTLLTAGNFARAAALSLLIGLPALLVSGESAPSVEGAAYALASGAITSALGYAIWYAALRDLSASLAAIAQLTVPAIAALGGMIFLEEPLTVRFLIATALILGGVALASLSRRKTRA